MHNSSPESSSYDTSNRRFFVQEDYPQNNKNKDPLLLNKLPPSYHEDNKKCHENNVSNYQTINKETPSPSSASTQPDRYLSFPSSTNIVETINLKKINNKNQVHHQNNNESTSSSNNDQQDYDGFVAFIADEFRRLSTPKKVELKKKILRAIIECQDE